MRLPRLLAVLVVFSSLSFAQMSHEEIATNIQTEKSVVGASATVSDLDTAHGGATVEILNRSDRDITAYAVAIKGILQDGHIIKFERMMDYGALFARNGEVLHPGETSTQPLQFFPKPSNPLVAVHAKVVAVVFADQTSEAFDSDALGRIVDYRASMALMDHISAAALTKALATASNHPGALAGSIVRSRINRTSTASSTEIDKQFMEAVAKEFEDAPNKAAATGATEREYLTAHLAVLQQRAEADDVYSRVRRQP
jgi:hypothetical protein